MLAFPHEPCLFSYSTALYEIEKLCVVKGEERYVMLGWRIDTKVLNHHTTRLSLQSQTTQIKEKISDKGT